MRTSSFHPLLAGALSLCMLSVCTTVAAQSYKVESQGQAAVDVEKARVVAVAMEKAVGTPAAGKGQVVFFRSKESPGAGIAIDAGGTAVGELPAGMYFPVPATAGTHTFVADGGASLSLDVSTGKTQYVQVIRNRAGQAQLLRSTATKFRRAVGKS